MTTRVFEAALGIGAPWSVRAIEFDERRGVLTLQVDFQPGTHFRSAGGEGEHPVHDTVTKTYRHLNFFQHECHLQVRTPRVRLQGENEALIEQFVTWQVNAERYGVSVEKLNAPLALPNRERSKVAK